MSGDSFLQQLLSLPSVTDAEVSPDGRWVAFTWYRVHENVDVFLVPSDGSAAPLALTNTAETTGLVGWAHDSRSIVVTEDHDGDEQARLFRVSIDRPGEMEPLTEDRPPYFIRGGDLDPDGKTLFYGANYDFERGEVLEPTWVYRHDLATGERAALAQPERPTWSTPHLNRQGTHLLYARQDRHPGGMQLWLVDVEGGEDREIINVGDDAKVSGEWLPDGQRILVVAESTGGRPQEHNSVGIFHWPSGSMRWLIDDPARSVEDAWVTPDGSLVVDEVRDAQHMSALLDPETGAETPFPRLPGNLIPVGRAADGRWVALYFSSTSPAELVLLPLDARSGADLVSLTRVWERTALDRARLAAAEDFRWTAPDGEPLQGWLYRAQPNLGRAILYIHGGPTSHSEDKLAPLLQHLVARGFNVLDVNYRGSTGFGLRFRELIKQDGWGGREQQDIAAAAQALIAAGLAEPGRIGVTGTSYGGYSSWFLITHEPPEVIAAAAPVCGMTDLVVDYNTTRPDLRTYSEEMLGGSPEQQPERYHERSPINFVHQIRGRLLIVQGAQDPNVTPANVQEVVRQLEAHQVPYELLVFEDEGHGIKRPRNQATLFTRLAEFFGEALG